MDMVCLVENKDICDTFPKVNNFNFEVSNCIKETKSWNICLVTSKNAFHVEKNDLVWSSIIKDVGISFTKLLHWILFFERNGIFLKLSFVRKYHEIQYGSVWVIVRMGICSLPRAIPGDEVAGGKCWGKSVRGREGEVCAFCQQYLMKRKIVQAYQGKTTTLI